jgi:hypothetical protein
MQLLRHSKLSSIKTHNLDHTPTYLVDFTKSKSIKTKFPSQITGNHRLINCPIGCTQHRTKSYRLAERKTFDPKKGICWNCNFKKLPKDAKFHGVGFKKASELGESA